MQVIQTNRFKKAYKKFHKNQLNDVNSAIKVIIENPLIGTQKKGDLSDIFVYKFKMINTLILLAYIYDDSKDVLILEAIGSHENFYRDIKR